MEFDYWKPLLIFSAHGKQYFCTVAKQYVGDEGNIVNYAFFTQCDVFLQTASYSWPVLSNTFMPSKTFIEALLRDAAFLHFATLCKMRVQMLRFPLPLAKNILIEFRLHIIVKINHYFVHNLQLWNKSAWPAADGQLTQVERSFSQDVENRFKTAKTRERQAGAGSKEGSTVQFINTFVYIHHQQP